MELKTVRIAKPDDVNFILGQAHFIKTVEDIHETIVSIAPKMKFGLGFCESSGPALVRLSGNDDALVALARENALALSAGHAFIIFMREGFPINILNAVKALPTVCAVFCATANPAEVVVAETGQGRGIIGVVDGVCTAGGLELALAMDILIAADTARFSDMHMKNLGRLGEWGGQTRLCRAVGPAKAKEILWTGIPFDGIEACRLGLVNRVVPHEKLLATARELAQTMAGMPGRALVWSKKSIQSAADKPLPEALQYERYCAEKAIEGVNPAEAPILKQWKKEKF